MNPLLGRLAGGLTLCSLACATELSAQSLIIDSSLGNSPYNIGPGSALAFDGGLTVGTQGSGVIVQTGGSLTAPNARFGSGGLYGYQMSGGAFTVGTLTLSYSTTGTFTLTDGTVTSGSTVLGFQTTGQSIFAQSGGLHSSQYLSIAGSDPSRGQYQLSGGRLQTNTTVVGYRGLGSFVHTGGSHEVVGDLRLPSGTYALSGAASSVTAGSLSLGTDQLPFPAGGSLTQDQGTIKILGPVRSGLPGFNGGSRGSIALRGGDFSCESLEAINGSFLLLAGGNCSVERDLQLAKIGNGLSATDQVTLSAGRLTVALGIGGGPGVSRVTFDGGTLAAGASGMTVGNLTALAVDDGGAVVDTAGFDATFQQGLLHLASLGATPDGGLRKVGAGILRLSGQNTYTGPTQILEGTLELSAGTLGGGALSAAAGATLALRAGTSATLPSLALAAGAICEVDGASLTVLGTLQNAGTLRVLRGGQLQAASASFVNTGLLDLLTGFAALPPGFVNQGTVLDSSAVRTTAVQRSRGQFTVGVVSHSGHRYQLQRSHSLAAETFAAVTADQAGTTGTELTFSVTADETAAFYRIVVDP